MSGGRARPAAPPDRAGGGAAAPRRRALLISTYDLGRPSFGLASPAAWLAAEGFQVAVNDTALDPLDEAAAQAADLIAVHVPMHTATRLAARLLPRLRALAPGAHLVVYGLYAALNQEHLRSLGADSVVSGEFEGALAAIARAIAGGSAPRQVRDVPAVVLDRLPFKVPERAALADPLRYAHVHMPDGEVRPAGATEASRGCRHRCRHCPVVPVYDGRFRVVPREVVLEDVRRQVAGGVRHITFGDPDFWNGPGHAMPLVRALHAEHPALSYDVTIKIEHLVRHADLVPELAATGCLFVTSAAEAVDDHILERLAKGHTRADFERAVEICRGAGLALQPTFVAFTPWTTAGGWLELIDAVEDLGLAEMVAPVQLALRLLIPAGSRLLELPEIDAGDFDPAALVHPWRHADPAVDVLAERAFARVASAASRGTPRQAVFESLRSLAEQAAGRTRQRVADAGSRRHAPVPYLSEPWYC